MRKLSTRKRLLPAESIGVRIEMLRVLLSVTVALAKMRHIYNDRKQERHSRHKINSFWHRRENFVSTVDAERGATLMVRRWLDLTKKYGLTTLDVYHLSLSSRKDAVDEILELFFAFHGIGVVALRYV